MANNEYLTAVLGQTFNTLGMQPNLATMAVNVDENAVVVAAQDSTGMTDLAFEVCDPSNSQLHPLRTFDTDGYFVANRLLSAAYGRFDIPAATVDPSEPKSVYVDIYSSPLAINQFHQRMGRVLGSDILKMVRVPGGGIVPPGKWLEGASNGDMLIADLNYWTDAQGDIIPSGHPQSWLNTPARFTRRLIDRAGELLDQYGDSVYAPAGERPEQVEYYVDSLDSIGAFTNPIQVRLLETADPHITDAEARSTVLDIINLKPDFTEPGDDRKEYVRYHGLQFEDLGVIDPDISALERRAAMRALSALYVKHIAHNLITIEQLQPAPEFSAQANRKRLSRLQGMMQLAVDHYTPSHALLI